MKYYRLTKGLIDKGILLPESEDVYSHINLNTDNYQSLFLFNEDQYKRFLENNSVAGITEVTTNKLLWDFDSKDISIAQKDAIKLIKRLEKLDNNLLDNIQIYFSGNKGFEVSIKTEESFTPKEMKNICMELAKDLESHDKQIYNATRQMRIPLTKHLKSNLYKIPLTISDLQELSISDIKENATNIDNIDIQSLKTYWGIAKLPKEINDMKNNTIEITINKDEIKNFNIDNIDWTLKPPYLSGAKWLLEQGFFEEGERSVAGMILASTYKSLGYDENKAYYNLKSAMQKQSDRTGSSKFPKQELWNNIIKQVYSPLWLGGTYSEKDNTLLAKLSTLVPKEIISAKNDVLTIDQVGEKFNVFVKNIDKNLLQFGIKSLDDSLDAMIGRVYIIGGSPGSGKSSLALQILNNTSKKNIYSMFFTFDMSVEDNNQKLIQKHFKLTTKQLFEQSKISGRLEEFKKKLNDEYGNVFFIDSSGMTKEIMENRILTTEKNLGIEIKLIVVDYLDLVQADFSDPTQKSMAVIQGLKEIATKHRKCVLVLSQPNKANQKINESVSSYAAIKGSSAVAELANAVLWVYRPGAQPGSFENDKYYSIDCLKNRHGAMFSIDLAWNGIIGEVRELTPIEKMDLKNLREQIKEQTNETKSNDWTNF